MTYAFALTLSLIERFLFGFVRSATVKDMTYVCVSSVFSSNDFCLIIWSLEVDRFLIRFNPQQINENWLHDPCFLDTPSLIERTRL